MGLCTSCISCHLYAGTVVLGETCACACVTVIYGVAVTAIVD